MSTIKTLIADDSVVYRSQIRAALESIAQIELVGSASNGKLALERLNQNAVDLLILDLEMPEKDGLQALRELKAAGHKCEVLVFASETKRSAQMAIEALRLGASDFLVKPSTGLDTVSPAEKIRAILEPRIQAIFKATAVAPKVVALPFAKNNTPLKESTFLWDLFLPQIVVIGSSTGGPNALDTILANYIGYGLQCPILIAQHMPPVFTAALAERLAKSSGLDVREAVHGEVLDQKRVYVAPGDYHMSLQRSNGKTAIVLDQNEKVNSVRPAVDVLFASAAELYKDRCLGLVLTGMGADGKVGAEQIKKMQGGVIIQNEASCVVYGMPGAVFAAGAYDRIADLSEIRQILEDKVLYFGGAKNVA